MSEDALDSVLKRYTTLLDKDGAPIPSVPEAGRIEVIRGISGPAYRFNEDGVSIGYLEQSNNGNYRLNRVACSQEQLKEEIREAGIFLIHVRWERKLPSELLYLLLDHGVIRGADWRCRLTDYEVSFLVSDSDAVRSSRASLNQSAPLFGIDAMTLLIYKGGESCSIFSSVVIE